MSISVNDLLAMGYDEDGKRIKDLPVPPKSKSAQREAELHVQVLDYCRRKGWPTVHSRMDRPQTAQVGTPDFVIALPHGKTLWIEAKTGKGKLTLEQQAWLAALRSRGHHAAVVRSMDEFIFCCDAMAAGLGAESLPV